MTDIVIVGAGPTGLTLACQLLRRGVACRVIDAAPSTSTRSRALGMSARSLEVLDEFGAAADLIERGIRCGVANFHSRGRRIGWVTASSARHTRFPFMLAVPQPDTEAVLERHLNRLGGTVERGVRLAGLTQDSAGVDLELDGAADTRTGWVIGADGERSAVRTHAGIAYTPTATDAVFVNVDAYLEDGPELGAGHYYFSAGAMTVLVGIAGGWYRVTTMVEPDGPELTPDGVAALVSQRVGRPLQLRELRDSGWGLNRVRIRTGVAEAFRTGRCLLAGDAAHVFGPVGAQGMNAGIQDAHNLAWKLALVSTGAAGPGLLDSYQAERRPVAHATLDHAVTQARLATVRRGIPVRDALVSLVTRIGLLDRKLGPTVTQLDTRYPGPRGTGTRLPDVPLGTATLFDLLREAPFTVLVLSTGPAPELTTLLRDRFGDLVAVRAIGHRLPGITGPSVVLVRPDGHIAYRGPLADHAALAGHLDRLLDVRKTKETVR
jgi:2-polyprenyl-6-methoxyphenol hydroxylase-like FAD-dependent oxidoreductase